MIEFFAWRIFEYVIVHMETGAMKELYQKCFNYLHQHSYRFFSNNFTGALVKKVNKLVRGYESVVDITFFNIVNVIIGMILIIYIGLKQHRFL